MATCTRTDPHTVGECSNYSPRHCPRCGAAMATYGLGYTCPTHGLMLGSLEGAELEPERAYDAPAGAGDEVEAYRG